MGRARIGQPDYIRQVRRGWQARPWLDGKRINLGIHPTPEAARRVVARFLAGKEDNRVLPKFVVRVPNSVPVRYRWHIKQKGVSVQGLTFHDTPEKAYSAMRAYLIRTDMLCGLIAELPPK